MNMIKLVFLLSLTWAVTASVLPEYVESLLSERGVSTAGGWSESFLADGTRVVTFHDTGESLRVDSISTVTEEKARELGFPGYGTSPLSEDDARDADYSRLSKREVRQRIYDGIAVAECPITGMNTRPIVVQSKLYEELRLLEIHPILSNIHSVYVPHGTEVSWGENSNGATITPNLIARVSRIVVLSGTSYCCDIVWGWLQPFDAEDFAEEGAEAPDYEVDAKNPEQERALETCYVMTANRCSHIARMKRSNCERIIIRWWN